MINKLRKYFAKYRALKIKLEKNTNLKIYLKSLFGSMLINLFIFIIPLLLVYNLFIIQPIMLLLKFIVLILVIIFSYFAIYFYVKLLSIYQNYDNIDFKPIVIVEGSILSIVLVTIFTIILFIVI